MFDKYILDENGDAAVEPDLMKWARWHESHFRRIARTELPNGYILSTIFLGVDYSGEEGTARLFETCIFFGWEALDHEQYATWEEAAARHIELREELRAREPNE